MKKNLFSQVTNRMLVALTVLLLSSTVAFSQVNIIAPTLADQVLVNGVNGLNWLNNSTFSGIIVNGNHRIVATTWQAGSTCSVSMYNGSSNAIQTIPVPLGYASVSKPDVAVGGLSAINQQAYVSVVYTARGIGGAPNQIFMTIYRIMVNGTNTVVVTGIKPSIPISNSTAGAGTAHIDLVYKELVNNMEATDFYVAWEDNDFAVSGVIGANACFGDVPTAFAAGTVPIANYLSTTYPTGVNGASVGARYVDVAGYERNVAGDNYAVFTFYDDNRLELFSRIWVQPSNFLSGLTSVDQGNVYRYPRVDAKDPRSQAVVGSSDFEIVYETPTPAFGANSVFGRADGYPINTITLSAFNPLVTPDNNMRPVVACGLGGRYAAVFWANMAGAKNILFQDLLWTTGAFASGTPDYRQVNTTAGAGSAYVAIANTWNFDAVTSQYTPLRNYISWYEPATARIKFKFYSTILPIMFKTTNGGQEEEVNAHIEELKTDGKFSVAPVPAENEIFIQSKDGELSKRYSIVDITGKVVLDGTITSYRQRVDISEIAKGMYILNVDDKSVRIVKQ